MTARARWYPGSRVQRLRSSHSYGFVLLVVTTLFLFAAAAPDERWTRGVIIILEAAVLASAAWTSGLGRAAVYVTAALGIVGIITVVVTTLGGPTAAGIVDLVGAGLIAAACAVMGVGVFDQGEVNGQSVLGAISVYVLIGMFFVAIYGSVAALGSGNLFAQGTDGTTSLRLYFSFVTLATVGYGDYTTSTQLAHTVAILEALIGQLYLVTVVATLVSHIPRRRETQSS